MQLVLDLQIASAAAGLPEAGAVAAWVEAALQAAGCELAAPELTVRMVDEAEGAELNQTWRHKTGPTNVLSFPFENPPGLELPLLGDIVICAPVVAREAVEQGKPELAHWAHLVTHGCLHLLGYDHEEETEATAMETLESRILERLGYPDPYRTAT